MSDPSGSPSPPSSPSSPTPTDIITYIGVPLAVLGVVPIFYTCLNSVFTLQNIRRHIRHNFLANATTRSSVLSGIVEVDLPRYFITPLSRDDADYWALNPYPSRLKGGSWSVFYWDKIATGKKSYRVSYSADMQEPQAEVDFDELLGFLLDRGAVPDPKGFRLLSTAGLWTPANTSLLVTSDGRESVLRVSFPDDSDGILSLALQWKAGWDRRGKEVLPPHWTCVRDFPSSSQASGASAPIVDEVIEGAEPGWDRPPTYEKMMDQTTLRKDIRLHLSMRDGRPAISTAGLDKFKSHHSQPPLEHLQEAPVSNWYPSLVTALAMMKGDAVWTCHIPDAFVALAKKDALPCGALVLCGILSDEEAPTWATRYDPMEDHRAFHEESMRANIARSAEMSLPPAQREAAQKLRSAQAVNERHLQFMKKVTRDRERKTNRENEAISSPRLDTVTVAEGSVMTLLKKEHGFDACEDGVKGLRDGAEKVLFEMARVEPKKMDEEVVDEKKAVVERGKGKAVEEHIAIKVCRILDRWQSWIGRGGMSIEDLEAVQKERLAFMYAIVLMAMLKVEGTRKESSLALDLQECLKTWKRVRLG